MARDCASEHAHRQLLAAFEARDADRAELIMKEHVFEARDVLIAQLSKLDGSKEGE